MNGPDAPPKLDRRDLRLLLELDRDCRQPLTRLAKVTRSALETARYRISRLERLGVIKNYLAVIDGGRLGFYYYKVFFRLHNATEEAVQRIIKDLSADPRICWIVRVEGAFDIGFTPRVSNPAEQSVLLDELRGKFSPYLRAWKLSVNIRMDFFSRDYLVSSARRKPGSGSYAASREPFTLDALGSKVLTKLAATPRASAASIATDIGVSTDTVLSRIRTMEQSGVLVRYSLVTDVRVLGHVNFYVLVYLSSLGTAREAEFVAACAAEPSIVYLIKTLGEWDYELSIEAPTIQAYRSVMMRLTRDFFDIVQEFDGLMVERLHKYLYP